MKKDVKKFYSYLNKKTIVQEGKSTHYFMIDLPFIDYLNDTIVIFGERVQHNVVFYDGGTTLINLERQGLDIEKSKTLKSVVNSILEKYDVVEDEGELKTFCDKTNFSSTLLRFVSAVIEINAFANMSKKDINNICKEIGKK